MQVTWSTQLTVNLCRSLFKVQLKFIPIIIIIHILLHDMHVVIILYTVLQLAQHVSHPTQGLSLGNMHLKNINHSSENNREIFKY